MKTQIKIDFFIIFLLVFTPFMIPVYFLEYLDLGRLFNLWKVASLLYTIIQLIIINKFVISKEVIILVIFSLFLFLSTLLYSFENLYEWSKYILSFIIPSIIFYFYLKNYSVQLLGSLEIILGAEIFINVITQIIFPNGLYLTGGRGTTIAFVLGMENRFFFTYITFLAFGIPLINCYKRFKVFYYVTLIVINISLFYAWSVGAMIAIVIFDILLILNYFKIFPLNIKKATIILLFLNLGIVFFQIQQYFASFIENVLKKSVTFSGRTALWNMAIDYIKQRFLFGYGMNSSEDLMKMYVGLVHPHNQLLQVLFQSGVLGFSIHILFIGSCLYKLSKLNDKKLYNFMIIVYFSLFIALIADSWTSTPYFYMIFFLFTMPVINNTNNNEAR